MDAKRTIDLSKIPGVLEALSAYVVEVHGPCALLALADEFSLAFWNAVSRDRVTVDLRKPAADMGGTTVLRQDVVRRCRALRLAAPTTVHFSGFCAFGPLLCPPHAILIFAKPEHKAAYVAARDRGWKPKRGRPRKTRKPPPELRGQGIRAFKRRVKRYRRSA